MNKKIKTYILENDYDTYFYSDREEAIKDYDYFLGMLTESEKKSLAYFRLYAIETDCEPSNLVCDYADYMTEMLCCFK